MPDSLMISSLFFSRIQFSYANRNGNPRLLRQAALQEGTSDCSDDVLSPKHTKSNMRY